MMSFARGRRKTARLYVATSPLARGLSVVTRRPRDRLSLVQRRRRRRRRRLPTLCATTTTPSHRHCTVNDDDRHKWRPLTSTGARSRVCVKIYGVTSHCFIMLYMYNIFTYATMAAGPYRRDLLSNHGHIFFSLLWRGAYFILFIFGWYKNSVTYPTSPSERPTRLVRVRVRDLARA